MIPRLLEHYRSVVVPKMMETFKLKNMMQVPRLKKIVVNMGVGKAKEDIKVLEAATQDLAMITGQKPVITRAKKAIANFKIREGLPIGCKVTLRKAKMYEFLDRVINVALPRIKDFRGISADSFDKGGNFSLGINEQAIFPEIDIDKVQHTQGMDIVIVTNAKNKEKAKELLRLFGMPFRS